jgi:hypothetical protein
MVKTNMAADRRGWKLAIVEYPRTSVRVSYDGIGGDMLSGGSALARQRIGYLESGRYEDFRRHIFGATERTLKRIMPNDQFHRVTDEIAMERLVGELKKHSSAANPTTSFFFWI